jgi:hypothetical protein
VKGKFLLYLFFSVNNFYAARIPQKINPDYVLFSPARLPATGPLTGHKDSGILTAHVAASSRLRIVTGKLFDYIAKSSRGKARKT